MHCNIATDGPFGSHQEQTGEHDGQGCPHEWTAAGAGGCTSGRINTRKSDLPLQWPHEYPWAAVITQALFSAACAYGHNTHRALCVL